MATFFPGESHTFSEYLLVPGYSSSQCIPNNVSLKTPLTRFKRGEKPAITLNIPMVSAIMQSVSGEKLAIALAKQGGIRGVAIASRNGSEYLRSLPDGTASNNLGDLPSSSQE